MKGQVVIFGANGFLGRYLTRSFLRRGREVVAVARDRQGVDEGAMFLEWDGRTQGPWALALEGAETVINLAGRSVNCRYTEGNRQEILDSRIESTEAIGLAIRGLETPPRLWVNASSATWYRHAGDRPQGEWSGEIGTGFSVEVAKAWEGAFFGQRCPGETRKVALRIGMVLANEPGSVHHVLGRLVRSGMGGSMAGGKQRVSWIHMEDFLSVLHWLEDQPLLDGVVNVTAPEAVPNADWMRSFREALAMPIGIPTPRWALRFGAWMIRTETELVTKSRWVEPTRLKEHGFSWRWPDLVPALNDLNRRKGMSAFFAQPEERAIGARAWTGARKLGVS
ncbi:TIGR01777 family oxidoreductase [Haloferula rosea]|uniref:TIGR01777 family oxidoreductase n=1 Tax=Haloferula rosea TaxID=490093 RepID=A0A934RBB6_9BACT|nr:TIGR01777 family oxidoreductase [Haloferula rosea]